MSSTAPASKHRSPLPLIVLGIVLIVFCILASLLEIQASESFLLHGPIVSFVPNWSILWQPYDLFMGHLSPDMAKATLWGWGIELVFLVCVIGYEIAHDGIYGTNKHLAGWFRTGAFALIIFNGYTDFQYGSLASGFWGQVAFAGVTTFMVMFFGVIGIKFLSHGFGEFTK